MFETLQQRNVTQKKKKKCNEGEVGYNMYTSCLLYLNLKPTQFILKLPKGNSSSLFYLYSDRTRQDNLRHKYRLGELTWVLPLSHSFPFFFSLFSLPFFFSSFLFLLFFYSFLLFFFSFSPFLFLFSSFSSSPFLLFLFLFSFLCFYFLPVRLSCNYDSFALWKWLYILCRTFVLHRKFTFSSFLFNVFFGLFFSFKPKNLWSNRKQTSIYIIFCFLSSLDYLDPSHSWRFFNFGEWFPCTWTLFYSATLVFL